MTWAEASRQGVWWLAAGCLAGFAFASGLMDAPNLLRKAPVFQLLYGVGFIGYVWLVWVRVMRRGRHYPRDTVIVLTLGVVLRLLIFSGPGADVLHRYVWEGRIQTLGWNPYRVAPNHPQLDELRDEHWSRIPNPELTAFDPPLSEMMYAALATLHPSRGFFKVAILAWDLVTLVALALWLQQTWRGTSWIAIYALSPLVLTAFAMEGHSDVMMLAWIALAGWASMRRYWLLCGAFLGLAVLSKPVAILLLFWLLSRNPRAALLAVGVILVGYMPYSGAGPGLLAGTFNLGRETLFNAFVPMMLEPFIGRGSAVTCGAAVILLYPMYLAMSRDWELHEYGVRVFAALLLVLPIVHFWYVSWILVFLAHRFRWRWVVLSGAMVFYFDGWAMMGEHGEWRLPTLSYYFIWAPFVITWAVEELGRYGETRWSAFPFPGPSYGMPPPDMPEGMPFGFADPPPGHPHPNHPMPHHPMPHHPGPHQPGPHQPGPHQPGPHQPGPGEPMPDPPGEDPRYGPSPGDPCDFGERDDPDIIER